MINRRKRIAESILLFVAFVLILCIVTGPVSYAVISQVYRINGEVFSFSLEEILAAAAEHTDGGMYIYLKDYLITAVIAAAATALITLLSALIIRSNAARPVEKLTESIREFTGGGDKKYMSDIKSRNEIAALGKALEEMTGRLELQGEQAAAKFIADERIYTELAVAKGIKQSIAPGKLEVVDEVEVYGLLQQCHKAGGGFYDYFFISPKRIGIVVAEVMGSGVSAAVSAVEIRTLIKSQLMRDVPVNEAMDVINTQLYDITPANTAIEAFVAVLDIDSGKLSYVNAGQNQPYMMKKLGYYELMSTQWSIRLGESRNVAYRMMEADIKQGDALVLYSSGTVKLKDENGEAYGVDRLRTFLNSQRKGENKPEEVLGLLVVELEDYGKPEQREEDAAVVMLKYSKGNKEYAEMTAAPSSESFESVNAFVKQRFDEKGIKGALRANVLISLEELFMLVYSRTNENTEIIVRCRIVEKRIELGILYIGEPENILETNDEKACDALSFVYKKASEVLYELIGEHNAVTMLFDYGDDI